MKKSLFLLLVMVPCLLQAQHGRYELPKHKQILSEPAKIILTYSAAIALDAAGDALNDKGEKQWGHLCNAASVGTMLMSFAWIDYDRKKWYIYPISYISLRISLFDPIYNGTRGLPLTHIGNTSTWDKALQRIAPPDGLLYGRGLTLILGITVPINSYKKGQ
jgi:hypothetical protein